MPSKIDITDIRGILRHVRQGRLKDALDAAKRCAVALGLWQQLDMLSAHERTYRAITEYMATEKDTAQRSRSLACIKEDLLRLADTARLDMDVNTPRPGREGDLYAAAVRTRRLSQEKPMPRLLADIAKAGAEERYALIDELFMRVVTTQHLPRPQAEALQLMLSDFHTDFDAAAMTISALGIANIYYYDRAKLLLLLDIPANESPKLLARRLTGIYLTLWRHPQRISLDPEVGERVAALLDDAAILAAMRKVVLAFLGSRDTQRINDKMQQEIIPELQKLQSDFVRRFPSQADLSELMDPEKNPAWDDLLGKSGLRDSLQELGDMQQQGGDVMMLAFSNLKNFPFFHRAGNWLLPYSPEHPALASALNANPELLKILDESVDFLCDPDKYSLGLALEKMPAGRAPMMLDQLRQQFEQYREDKKTSFHKDTEPAVNLQITLYVRSLSRLVSLFPHQGLRMPNPFATAINPATLPFLGLKMNGRKDLRTVSEFLLTRGYYGEALPVLHQLEKLTPDSAELLEKIGYCQQQLGDTEDALNNYIRAEELQEHPGPWLMRKLASLHRAMGHHAEAARYWQRLSDANPDDPKATLQLANALFDAGDIEGALKKYYKVDYLRGGSERTWRPIAWCEFRLGNYDKAQSYYDRLLKGGTDSADLLNAGHLTLARGDLSGAIDLYTRAARAHKAGLPDFLTQLAADADILAAHGLDAEAQAILSDRLAFALHP